MTSVFLWILKMSIQGSFVALVVMTLRALLKDRPKRYAYSLWLVVLLRLLLPLSLETSFSLMPRAVTMPTFLDGSLTGMEEMERPSMGIPGEIAMEAEKSDISSGVLEGVTILYGLGFGLLFIHFLYSHLKLQEKMRGAKKKADGIYIGKSIELPFSYGILNKRIYLPLGLSSEEQTQIVAHERVHIKRQDPLIKMGAYFILLVHWFNPILWLSYILMTKDMEMSCDERALKEASKEEKYVYAKVLLRISEEAPKSLPATAYSIGDVGQRLKNIFSFQKTNRKEKVVFSFILFLMLALLLTNPLVKVTGNVEHVFRDLKPVENIFGDHLEVFEEEGLMLIGRLNHEIDPSFDKTKLLSMEDLRREFFDEKTGMMIHESLHFLPGDTIYVEDDIDEILYDEEENSTYLGFFVEDGFQESVLFKGDLRERFADGTSKRVNFKFQVKPILSFSDRFQILDYNEIYQETGEIPPIDSFLP